MKVGALANSTKTPGSLSAHHRANRAGEFPIAECMHHRTPPDWRQQWYGDLCCHKSNHCRSPAIVVGQVLVVLFLAGGRLHDNEEAVPGSSLSRLDNNHTDPFSAVVRRGPGKCGRVEFLRRWLLHWLGSATTTGSTSVVPLSFIRLVRIRTSRNTRPSAFMWGTGRSRNSNEMSNINYKMTIC